MYVYIFRETQNLGRGARTAMGPRPSISHKAKPW